MREDVLERHRDRDALFDVTIEPPAALLLEVSAAYEATYMHRIHVEKRRAAAAVAGGDEQVAAAEALQGERGDGLSFVWGLFGDFLRRIKSNVLRQRTIAAPLG